MRMNLLFAGLFILSLTSCGPTIYKASNFESTRNAVKTVAILPFMVAIDSNRLPKGVKVESLKKTELQAGYNMQKAAYTWFLRRQSQYTVAIQNVDTTNALLNNTHIPFDSLSLQDKGALCRLLNVDAVISGNATSSRPASDGAAIATWLVIGGVIVTDKRTLSLYIHNSNSDLLWKYHYHAEGGMGTTAKELNTMLMKKASKKFPYKTS